MQQVKEWNTMNLLATLVVLVLVAGLFLALTNIADQRRILSIMSFEECAMAGYPIMESYPEQCRTPDGRLFVNEVQAEQMEENPLVVRNGCAVAGCSSQLCVSADNADEIVTTCEWREEYACYQRAICERQVSGECGWTNSIALQQCLDDAAPVE